MSFPIDIAFDEPPAAEGVPVVLLLNLIQSEVSRLITDMGPHLM
jgi:hypothetical protein